MRQLYRKLSGARLFANLDGIVCLTTSVVSALVLVGWYFDIETLKRVLPKMVAMNPVTAVAFILISGSLFALYGRAIPNSQLIGRLAAFIVLVIAALKLCEVLFGFFTGIDQLLFSQKLQFDLTGKPNRMAPNTALNLLLLSTVLLFSRKTIRRHLCITTVLLVVALINSFLPLLGYLYGTRLLYGVGHFIPMAPQSAVLFLMLSITLLFARSGNTIVGSFSDKGAGGVMLRRILPVVILFPILLGWLRLHGEKLVIYDNELGIALMVVVQILGLVAVVLWNSSIIVRLDKERNDAEERLKDLSLTDDLTGLRNRRGFWLLSEQEIKLARNERMGIFLWCVYADLDGLKAINDSLGHAMGSQAICDAADVFRKTFRASDIIARLGGDEFAILAATNLPDGGKLLIQRLKQNVETFNDSARPPYNLSISFGLIRVNPQITLSLDDILNQADAAMYQDKRRKK